MELKVIYSVVVAMIVAMPLGASAQEQEVNKNDTSYYSAQATPRPKTRDHRGESTSEKFRFAKKWMIGANNTGTIDGILNRGVNPVTTPESFYNLKSLHRKRFLQYERQGTTGGINIGWTDNASAQEAVRKAFWGFFPENASSLARADVNGLRSGPIVYGEKVAIAWWPGDPRRKQFYKEFSKRDGAHVPKFLAAVPRNVGPNLAWDERGASYEWVILGGEPGKVVRRGEDTVILFNLKKKKALTYAIRRNGANISLDDDDVDLSVYTSMMLKPARDALR